MYTILRVNLTQTFSEDCVKYPVILSDHVRGYSRFFTLGKVYRILSNPVDCREIIVTRGRAWGCKRYEDFSPGETEP